MVSQQQISGAAATAHSTFQGGRVVGPGVIAGQHDPWMRSGTCRAWGASSAGEGCTRFADYLVPSGFFGDWQFVVKRGGEIAVIKRLPVTMPAEDAGKQAVAAVDDPLAVLSGLIEKWEG